MGFWSADSVLVWWPVLWKGLRCGSMFYLERGEIDGQNAN